MNLHILDAKEAGFHEVGKSTTGELLDLQAKAIDKKRIQQIKVS